MSDVDFLLAKQIEAARVLREQLGDLAKDDPDFVRDMIEGETSLREQIAALAAAVMEDQAIVSGIKQLRSDLEARSDRIEKRAEIRRALIANAMEMGEIVKLETPACTLTSKAVPFALQVVDEAEIPTRYWAAGAPKLDRRTLLESLKARSDALAHASEITDAEERAAALAKAEAEFPAIPGVELSNGSRTIQFRGK